MVSFGGQRGERSSSCGPSRVAWAGAGSHARSWTDGGVTMLALAVLVWCTAGGRLTRLAVAGKVGETMEGQRNCAAGHAAIA